MSRIALALEYDGTTFEGWQTQPARTGVQDALEAALAGIANAPVRVVAAGRTDAGVHAALQIVHFDAPVVRPPQAWVRGTNAYLPASVAVRWALPVDASFHARFGARSRSYTYVLMNRAVRPALDAGRVGWFHAPLELEAMRAAAHHLVGEHDFTAFRAASCQAATPVRTLHRCDVARHGECVVFRLRANAFLHHMVRNVVGCLVYVGAGRQPPEWMAEVLSRRDRALAAPTFAPDGLYLTGVEYDATWGLPESEREVHPLYITQQD
jgi:tRNA pseudouridine38-40 synthase